MLSLKVFLISAAVLFTALGLKASLPFTTTHLPLIWNLFLLCCKPPYPFFIVNAIIISIVASSRFHHSKDRADPTPPPIPVTAYEMKSPPEFTISKSPVVFEQTAEDPPVLEVKAVVVNGSAAVKVEGEKAIDHGMDSMEQPTWTSLKWIDSTEVRPEYLSPTEKPLVSARLAHRKPRKSTPEVVGGRALRMARPKRQETLENTWKAITGGHPIPLRRHMKKCDTGPVEVKKSASFKDRTTQPPLPPKLRKEPSLSQDELNRRVEAFIHKFKEQMRLQRQESFIHKSATFKDRTTQPPLPPKLRKEPSLS